MLLGSAILTACGEESSEAGDLPEIRPTTTSLPLATPTEAPVVARAELRDINWEDTSHMAPAMRPQYVSDLENYGRDQRYFIEASLELSNVAAVVTGTQYALYLNDTGETLNDIVFRLYPNMPSKASQMSIDNIMVAMPGAEPVAVEGSVEVRETVLRVSLPEPLAVGESVELVMDFVTATEHGMNMSQRVGYEQGLFTMGGWHPVFAPYEADRGWWTDFYGPLLDPNYSEIALYEVFLTHERALAVAISGVTIDRADNGDGTVTEHIVTGPMRYSLIVASYDIGSVTQYIMYDDKGEYTILSEDDYVVLSEEEIENNDIVAVNVYFLPDGERAADWGLETAVNSVTIFNRLYGDYPYSEIDITETYTRAGGIEYPGIVTINTNSWQNGSNRMELVIAHEVAHQWWFGVVGNNQLEAPWIDESLASYSEYVYYREAYDDNNLRAQVQEQGDRQTYNNYLGGGGLDVGLNEEVDQISSFQIFAIYYVKGPIFYNELEEQLGGRENLYAGLANYYQNKRYGTAKTNDILTYIKEANGLGPEDTDLDVFFYEWVGDFEGLDPAVKEAVDAERISANVND
jgi:hypothetical protein